LKNLKEMPKNL